MSVPDAAMIRCFNPFYEEERGARLVWNVGPYQIVRCPQSGLLFLANPIASEDALREFYSVKYFEGAVENKGYASYARDEAILRHNFRGNLAKVLADLKAANVEARAAKLLDMGCAYGYFLDEARGAFGEVRGIEINEDVAAIGRQRFGLTIDSAEDALQKMASASLDVVTLWDVIEHLKCPRAVLLECARILKPGGSLYLTTGDAGSMLARTMGRYWRLITPPQHICFFTIPTMTALLDAAGLRVARTRKFGKQVSLSMILFQLSYMVGLRRAPRLFAERQIHIPINLFDVMFVHAVKAKA